MTKAITGKLDWQAQSIVPAFLQGEDAEAIYEATEGIRTGTMSYDAQNRLVYGSTPFLAAKVDTLVRPLGMRAANPRDLSRPEIMRMVKNKHYVDTPVFVVRSEKDEDYPRNNPLIRKILDEASRFNPQFPFMVSGFDANPAEDGGYNITIVPRDDFNVVYDERLSGSNHRRKFTNVDDLGLPLFDKKGDRTFWARDKGLSWFYLDWDLYLDSNGRGADSSGSDGRVVMISGEATSQKNLSTYIAGINVEMEKQIAEIAKRAKKSRDLS